MQKSSNYILIHTHWIPSISMEHSTFNDRCVYDLEAAPISSHGERDNDYFDLWTTTLQDESFWSRLRDEMNLVCCKIKKFNFTIHKLKVNARDN